MDVERVATFVHVRVVGLGGLVLAIPYQVAINLDSLRAVALLSV